MTEIEFIKDEGIISFKPNKMNKGGYDLEISLCKDFVCFSVVDGGNATNVQMEYNEFQRLVHLLHSVRVKQSFAMDDTILEKEPQELQVAVKDLEPIPKTHTHKRNVKISYLEKWIQNNNFDVFTLDMFFKKYPKQRGNKSLENHIRSLINRKVISQFNKPSGEKRFKVNGRK